jgi:hypothetical protein
MIKSFRVDRVIWASYGKVPFKKIVFQWLSMNVFIPICRQLITFSHQSFYSCKNNSKQYEHDRSYCTMWQITKPVLDKIKKSASLELTCHIVHLKYCNSWNIPGFRWLYWPLIVEDGDDVLAAKGSGSWRLVKVNGLSGSPPSFGVDIIFLILLEYPCLFKKIQ